MNKTGAELIIQERDRQLTDEGFSPEHDDLWKAGELAKVAICYVQHANMLVQGYHTNIPAGHLQDWPFNWDEAWWNPKDDPVRDLVRAGALIAAEIDRLLRRKPSDE
jgi:hypothetical protein